MAVFRHHPETDRRAYGDPTIAHPATEASLTTDQAARIQQMLSKELWCQISSGRPRPKRTRPAPSAREHLSARTAAHFARHEPRSG